MKSVSYISLLAVLLTATACVQFKQAQLYSGVEQEPTPEKPKTISLLVEPLIYDDGTSDVWGIETNACQTVTTTDVAYSGNEALLLNWNRGAKDCKWSGIGIGWDGYAGKDLSGLIDYAAIQMYVRTQEGRSFGLPFVLTLEDYSGGMGFCYTSNKYFERTAIDEEWQKVVVPLSDFETQKENLDPTNIKQLQIELQQSGSVYLDDVRLVFYTPQPQEPWMQEEERDDPTNLPVQLFDDAFVNNNGWGMISDQCQDFHITSTEKTSGQQSIHLQWSDQNDRCKLKDFGVSWNRWFPVDLSSLRDRAAIQFQLKMASGQATSLPIQVGFEDYERAKQFAELTSDFIPGGQYNTTWQTVTIPLTAIPEAGFDFRRTKQLYVRVKGSGEVYMDDIKLIRLR